MVSHPHTVNYVTREMGRLVDRETQKEMGGILKQSDKEKEGAVEDDGGRVMAELESEQAMKSERLMKNYKKWKIMIISVICFVMLFMMAFLLTMFICKEDC